MRAAKNADKLEKLAAENGNTVADLSGRGAMRLLAPQPTEEEKAEAQAERDAKKAEAEAKRKAKTTAAKAAAKADPAAVLEDLEADEVLDAITDGDKKAELLKRQLRYLTPHEIVRVLDEAWMDDDDSGLKMQRSHNQPPEVTASGSSKTSKDHHSAGTAVAAVAGSLAMGAALGNWGRPFFV